jgi:hypothetical protein
MCLALNNHLHLIHQNMPCDLLDRLQGMKQCMQPHLYQWVLFQPKKIKNYLAMDKSTDYRHTMANPLFFAAQIQIPINIWDLDIKA